MIDAGCGAGVCFQPLEEAIGPQGDIIGIDVSPAMLELARDRVGRAGWTNVTLIESSVQAAQIPGVADAAVFCFAQDVVASPSALEVVVGHLKPAARFTSVGATWGPWWRAGANLAYLRRVRTFGTSLRGRGRHPWRPFEPYCQEIDVDMLAGGRAYVASGCIASPNRRHEASADISLEPLRS